MAEAAEEIRLTEREYEQLRQSTETYREELLVRLCGEVGLRAAEIPRLKPADVQSLGGEGRTQYFVTVHESDGGTREAYLPPRVAHDFWQYVRSNDIETDQSVIDVSTRRVQMLVGEVGERAAEWAGRPTLASVTPSILRRFFAQQLLVSKGVDPRIITTIGGWEGVDGLLPPLEEPPRDEITAAFERLEDGQHGAGKSARLRALVKTLDEVGEALSAAGSRGEIEEAVCQTIVADETYDAAWVTERERHRERIDVRTHAGEDPERYDDTGDTTLIRQALQSNRVLVAPDRPQPGAAERGLLAAVPLVHGETTYGALVVRADSQGAFDDPERTALADLGRRIGLTITATERRQLLLGDTVVRLTLQYTDRGAVLVDLAQTLDCDIELTGVVAADAHSLLCFVTVDGTAPETVLNWVSETDSVGDARLIRSFEDGALLEMVIESDSPALALTERGGTVTELSVENGAATIVTEFAPNVGVRPLVDELNRQYPTVELRSKQEVTPTDQTPAGFRESIDEKLTEKQQSVLRAAYHAGYFEWPRGSTAEELAESMDISSPTLHNHLRRAQQKLLGVAFDDE
jgi:predicted DNA binding protein